LTLRRHACDVFVLLDADYDAEEQKQCRTVLMTEPIDRVIVMTRPYYVT